jgi:hypothetical protein
MIFTNKVENPYLCRMELNLLQTNIAYLKGVGLFLERKTRKNWLKPKIAE